MKVSFAEKDPMKIKANIDKVLSGRKLGEIVSLEMQGKELLVIFSKLGKSVLTFQMKEKNDGVEYNLTNEKIALTHKAFKNDITDKFCKAIEQAGGKVVT